MLDADIEEFLLHQQARGLRASTLERMRVALRRLPEWLAARRINSLSSVSERDIVAFVAEEKRRGVQTRNIISSLRTLFSWVTSSRHLASDPAARLEPDRAPRPLPRLLSESEMDQLLATALLLRERAIVELIYSSALRRAEIAQLDRGDVDLDRRLVTVRGGKGGRDRTVPLGRKAAAVIDLYIRYERDGRLARGETALFVTERGRRLRPAHVARIILEAGRRAKLGVTLTPHMLRHSAATHLLARGASIRHVQELLGHASINTTEIYTHLAVGDLAKVHGKAHPLGKERG